MKLSIGVNFLAWASSSTPRVADVSCSILFDNYDMHIVHASLIISTRSAPSGATGEFPSWVPLVISLIAVAITGYNIWLTGARARKHWAFTRLADAILNYWTAVDHVRQAAGAALHEAVQASGLEQDSAWAHAVVRKLMQPISSDEINVPASYGNLAKAIQPLQYLVSDHRLRASLKSQQEWAEKVKYAWESRLLDQVAYIADPPAENFTADQIKYTYELLAATTSPDSLFDFQDLGAVLWETHLPSPLSARTALPKVHTGSLVGKNLQDLVG